MLYKSETSSGVYLMVVVPIRTERFRRPAAFGAEEPTVGNAGLVQVRPSVLMAYTALPDLFEYMANQYSALLAKTNAVAPS
jgi:hypothetical protein